MAMDTDELRRLRQVHQYSFLRNEPVSLHTQSIVQATRRSTPDTAMTAFTQLLAWRLNAPRALISLVDKHDQFFLAESTRTLQLADPGKSDVDGDLPWQGCSGSTTRGVALCAYTIQAPIQPQGYPSFCVTDLANHPQFRNLPYVQGPPHFRFYGGTPLIAKDGSRIGSLFVLDQNPRDEGLSQSELEFLGAMASNVMAYMEMQRESEERKRIAVMSKGLAAFTEGKHRIPSAWFTENEALTGTSKAHAKEIDERRPENNANKKAKAETTSGRGKDSQYFDAHVPMGAEGDSSTHESVLARASNLLRESLDVDFTLFLDATSTESQISHFEDLLSNTAEASSNEKMPWSEKGKTNQRPADILSFSTKELSSSSQHSSSLAEFKTVPRHFVKHLMHKYSKGHLWSFDENGSPIDDEDSTVSDSEPSDVGFRIKIAEYISLAAYFPEARQVLYVPIFDPANSRCICACFAVSLRDVPIFTDAIEVAFARAFCNSVFVEWDRVSVGLANRQKGDFLSSISHASLGSLNEFFKLSGKELLSGSNLDIAQTDLCDTIFGCGRTLLNTVSHILDYTKVNEFHQRVPAEMASKPSLSQDLAGIVSPCGFVSSLELNSKVDVAVICESVVHAVWAGHLYDQKLPAAHVLSHPLADDNTGTSIQPSAASLSSYPVEVIMEILPGDWKFNCTPGAIQRILMNLIGNSLKFTKTGHIKIQLGNQEDTPSAQIALIDGAKKKTSLVTMKIIDTGCGISEDFLKTKLYTPFSQESALDAGTGLGLSMTQKIVQALDGEITIQSEIGCGTEVCVQIPLIRATDRTPDIANNDGISSSPSDVTSPVSAIRNQCMNRTVALYGFDSPSLKLLSQSINLYVSEWYTLQTTQDLSLADFVIVDESALDDMIKSISDPSALSQTVVLRNTPTKDPKLQMATYDAVKPVGPHGLAKVLLRCWTRNQISMKHSITKPITRGSATRSIMKDCTINSITKPVKSIGKAPLRISMPATKTPWSNTYSTTRCIDIADQVGNADRDILPSNGELSQCRTLKQQFLKEQTSMTRVHSIDEQCQDILAKSTQPYILCVDDNRLNLKILQAFLQKLNYKNIKCAENGLEAFKIVESTSIETGFDLVFMDLSMPICDGFESTERIRKFEKSRKDNHSPNAEPKSSFIIALTGQASIRDQTQALAAGVDRFVTKPMSLEYLQNLLEELSEELKIAKPNS